MGWLDGHGQQSGARLGRLSAALMTVICADLIRPSLSWLAGAAMRGGLSPGTLPTARDPAGFARLRELCDRDPASPPEARADACTAAP